jgi:hypothetical protein
MSSTKMTMIFNQKFVVHNSLVNPNNTSVRELKTSNNNPVSKNRGRVKSAISLGNIMHMSINSTPCKACGS